jgi:hypothetical protein
MSLDVVEGQSRRCRCAGREQEMYPQVIVDNGEEKKGLQGKENLLSCVAAPIVHNRELSTE